MALFFFLRVFTMSFVASLVISTTIHPKGIEELINTLLLNQLALTDIIQDKNHCDDVKETLNQLKYDVTRGLALINANVERQSNALDELTRELKSSMHDLHFSLPRDIKAAIQESHSSILNDVASSISAKQTELQNTIRATIAEQLAGTSNRGIDSGLVEVLGPLPTRMQDNDTVGEDRVCSSGKPVDCLGHRRNGESVSGVYEIYPFDCCRPVRVWCDMYSDGGGWTVMLSRGHHLPHALFNRTWREYGHGFGHPYTEYWLGNDILHSLTKDGPYVLRVDAEDFAGTWKYGKWSHFSVANDRAKYKLSIGGFQPASSTLGDDLTYHNGVKFSTFDNDNDENRAACVTSHGANGGWWHKSCTYSSPTGPISNTNAIKTSMVWYNWAARAKYTSLRWLQLKIQQKDSQGPIRMCQDHES